MKFSGLPSKSTHVQHIFCCALPPCLLLLLHNLLGGRLNSTHGHCSQISGCIPEQSIAVDISSRIKKMSPSHKGSAYYDGFTLLHRSWGAYVYCVLCVCVCVCLQFAYLFWNVSQNWFLLETTIIPLVASKKFITLHLQSGNT